MNHENSSSNHAKYITVQNTCTGKKATSEQENFVHVSSLNEVYGHSFDDHVNLTNRFKMPNVEEIIKEVVNSINLKNKQGLWKRKILNKCGK